MYDDISLLFLLSAFAALNVSAFDQFKTILSRTVSVHSLTVPVMYSDVISIVNRKEKRSHKRDEHAGSLEHRGL